MFIAGDIVYANGELGIVKFGVTHDGYAWIEFEDEVRQHETKEMIHA